MFFGTPPGYTNATSANQLTNDAVDSDASVIVANGTATAPFTVNTLVDNLTFDAGFYNCIMIGETIWYDDDKDDIKDPIENGINGILVSLYKKN